MHVITGGAYHGKAKWVRQYYQVDQEVLWISAYSGDSCPKNLPENFPLIVLEGIEQWIYEMVKEGSYTRTNGRNLIDRWLKWEEKEKTRRLVVIGTDISKGIVPIEKEHRRWRDHVGWFFQDLVSRCERFDVIWYGLHQRLK